MFSQCDADNFEYGIAYKEKLLALFENEQDRDISLGAFRNAFPDIGIEFEKIEPEEFE